MKNTHLYIIFIFGFLGQVCAQISPEEVAFDKLIENFKYNDYGFEIIVNDSVSEKSLYKSKYFNVSISQNPIYFEITHT